MSSILIFSGGDPLWGPKTQSAKELYAGGMLEMYSIDIKEYTKVYPVEYQRGYLYTLAGSPPTNLESTRVIDRGMFLRSLRY